MFSALTLVQLYRTHKSEVSSSHDLEGSKGLEETLIMRQGESCRQMDRQTHQQKQLTVRASGSRDVKECVKGRKWGIRHVQTGMCQIMGIFFLRFNSPARRIVRAYGCERQLMIIYILKIGKLADVLTILLYIVVSTSNVWCKLEVARFVIGF